MSTKRTSWRIVLRCLAVAVGLASTLSFQGCATTVGNIALGTGIGAVGTVAALGCALTCHGSSPGW